MYMTVFTIILTFSGQSLMKSGEFAMIMVKVEDAVVAKSGRVPTILIEQVPTCFFELTMILPVNASTLIKGTLGESEQVQVLERVPHLTLAENGLMSN